MNRIYKPLWKSKRIPYSRLSYSFPSQHPKLTRPIKKFKKSIKLQDLPIEILLYILEYLIQDQTVRNPENQMTRQLILLSTLNRFFYAFIYSQSVFWKKLQWTCHDKRPVNSLRQLVHKEKIGKYLQYLFLPCVPVHASDIKHILLQTPNLIYLDLRYCESMDVFELEMELSAFLELPRHSCLHHLQIICIDYMGKGIRQFNPMGYLYPELKEASLAILEYASHLNTSSIRVRYTRGPCRFCKEIFTDLGQTITCSICKCSTYGICNDCLQLEFQSCFECQTIICIYCLETVPLHLLQENKCVNRKCTQKGNQCIIPCIPILENTCKNCRKYTCRTCLEPCSLNELQCASCKSFVCMHCCLISSCFGCMPIKNSRMYCFECAKEIHFKCECGQGNRLVFPR